LASRLGEDGGAVDGAGRLWLLDATSGDLVWLDGQPVGRRTGVVTPGPAGSSSPAGRRALVDGSQVRALDPGRRVRRVDLPGR
jgi:hypothetical protein